jgi:hypothetical protein
MVGVPVMFSKPPSIPNKAVNTSPTHNLAGVVDEERPDAWEQFERAVDVGLRLKPEHLSKSVTKLRRDGTKQSKGQ